MLELSAVSTRYGPVPMLHEVSLNVAKGELVCLLGPNGAGKSTTFNTICGLIAPTRGQVRIMGRDLAGIGTEGLGALGVGVVPEGRRLFPSLTVEQNLRLGHDAARCTRPFAERLAAMAGIFPRIRERLGRSVLRPDRFWKPGRSLCVTTRRQELNSANDPSVVPTLQSLSRAGKHVRKTLGWLTK